EALAGRGAGGQLRGHYLESDDAMQLGIEGLVDNAHPSAADFLADLEAPEPLRRGGRICRTGASRPVGERGPRRFRACSALQMASEIGPRLLAGDEPFERLLATGTIFEVRIERGLLLLRQFPVEEGLEPLGAGADFGGIHRTPPIRGITNAPPMPHQ